MCYSLMLSFYENMLSTSIYINDPYATVGIQEEVLCTLIYKHFRLKKKFLPIFLLFLNKLLWKTNHTAILPSAFSRVGQNTSLAQLILVKTFSFSWKQKVFKNISNLYFLQFFKKTEGFLSLGKPSVLVSKQKEIQIFHLN